MATEDPIVLMDADAVAREAKWRESMLHPHIAKSWHDSEGSVESSLSLSDPGVSIGPLFVTAGNTVTIHHHHHHHQRRRLSSRLSCCNG